VDGVFDGTPAVVIVVTSDTDERSLAARLADAKVAAGS
jgi:hypothetical protein